MVLPDERVDALVETPRLGAFIGSDVTLGRRIKFRCFVGGKLLKRIRDALLLAPLGYRDAVNGRDRLLAPIRLPIVQEIALVARHRSPHGTGSNCMWPSFFPV
jgi:hypothetical protein